MTLGVLHTDRVTSLGADLRHMSEAWTGNALRDAARMLGRVLLFPRARAVVYYRASTWLWHHHLRPVAYWCQARSIRTAGAEIHPASVIGPGLALTHSVGIVVGADVIAGRDLVLHHGVTLGHGGGGAGQPRLGNGVRIGAGASILGPVTVGDNARIGAGAVVLADVPADTTVVGVWK